jgi:hypothetical protein
MGTQTRIGLLTVAEGPVGAAGERRHLTGFSDEDCDMLGVIAASNLRMRAAVVVWTGVACAAGVVLAIAGRQATASGAEMPRTPVLVELFTSEGCSSCPSADALLRHLDETQPVDGAEVIVLSEHVDYWNRLGWADPFSSPMFTERQSSYASTLDAQGLYTPQAVIDGASEVIGNDRPALTAAIATAARRPKAPLRVEVDASPTGLRVAVDGGALAEPRVDVVVALAERDLVVKVPRGENARKTLRHTGVVRRLVVTPGVDGRRPLSLGQIDLPIDATWARDALRIVAFAQAAGQRRVLAIGTADVP